jgi:UDPglucose 6-dehydrogenase
VICASINGSVCTTAPSCTFSTPFTSIGYGGACFPKDVQALTATGRQHHVDVSLLEAVEHVNHLSWENYVTKVTNRLQPGAKVAIWGLAFKANTDDIRFAPAVKIAKKLSQLGYKVTAYDPAAMSNVKKELAHAISYTNDQYGALAGAEALCVLTEWNEFRQADMQKVKDLLTGDLIIDGRNLYDIQKMKQLGFTYVSTGR